MWHQNETIINTVIPAAVFNWMS